MVRSMFLRDESGNPICCLNFDVKDNVVHYQLSTYNPLDKFDRKRAHEIALARLTKRPYVVSLSPIDEKYSSFQITHAIIEDLIQNHADRIIPTRTVKSAKRWVKNFSQQLEAQL
jgi:predicted transcriptional regulator YheO